MTENKSISKKRLILLLLLLITGGYSYYLYESNAKLNTEKTALIDNLTKSRDSIASVINENSSIKEELLVEQQKITNLIDELKESKATVEELNKYKTEVVKLKKQVILLKSDKMELVEKYEALKNKQDSTLTVLKNKEESNGSGYDNTKVNLPSNRGTSLSEHLNVTKSKNVVFANLKVETYSANKTLTKMVTTDKSDMVNFCRIKFLIRGNPNVSDSKGRYYVQIINPEGEVIGYKLSHKFGSIVLDYSYHEDYSYAGENLEEISGLPLSALSKGNYTIYLFKNDKIALKSGFTLI
ncbi:hypothetical protein DMB65_08730 [Flavobacterium cheongpyeongense]|uniref:Chromosome partitioning protein ParA n=1 Tax=Flavobacterium cheongpyeongense TaxID=2212651 RepID=A0A2V4BQ44_9FLAO|nr:hypothetical protein [Flavobacterium cheongpyeongense]PXY41035.1 hypothetical protein DMB65_08730 [Flavobacterium cheongpyeongense]